MEEIQVKMKQIRHGPKWFDLFDELTKLRGLEQAEQIEAGRMEIRFRGGVDEPVPKTKKNKKKD